MSEVIVITSGKGGVGKTTTVANIDVYKRQATRLPIHWKTDVAFILSVCVPADML